MMIKGYEDVHSQLLTENDILRDRVSRINNELHEILQTRKDFLIKTRKIEMGEEFTEDFDLNYSNMMNFKKELLNMPMDSVNSDEISMNLSRNWIKVGKETLDILQENIKRFKDFMKKMDGYNRDFESEFNEENDPELERIRPLKNLKNLLSFQWFYMNFFE